MYTELLKMKGSRMFLVSLLGAVVSPLMTFFMLLGYHSDNPDEPLLFINLFNQTHLFITFLVGILLFALIATYLINREFEEGTVKNLLTIPVSRIQLILSKMIILFVWIEVIMIFSYSLLIILGFIGGFQGLNIAMVFTFLKKYLFTGFLLYLLTPIISVITLIFRSYVPSIAFSIFFTVGNLIIIQSSKYVRFYPWGIPLLFTTDNYQPEYSLSISWFIILAFFIVSITANLIYFYRTDIN